MRTFQKVIKVMALCLAALIVVSLIGGLLGAFGLVGTLVDGDYSIPGDSSVIWEDKAEVRVDNLQIEVGAAHLRLVTEDETRKTRVETNSEYITTWVEGDTLRVQERTHSWFWLGNGRMDVTVYIPEKHEYDNVFIDSGAGTVDIEKLLAKKVELKVGAGRTKIDKIEVASQTKIDGGAGMIEIRDGVLSNLDLELGAGSADITVRIGGNSNRVQAGVGRLALNLLGNADSYGFTVDKGIGSVTIDGKKQSDGDRYGDGENRIDLECGIGAVEVKLVDKNSIM